MNKHYFMIKKKNLPFKNKVSAFHNFEIFFVRNYEFLQRLMNM